MVRLNRRLDHPFCPTRMGGRVLWDGAQSCRRAPECVHNRPMPVDAHPESESSGVRAHVADSWLRSAAAGVRSTPSTRRSRCPRTRCATTGRRTRSRVSSRCSTTSSVRRRATATPSWPSRTPPASCCGCAGRRACCAAPSRIGFVEGSNWDERLAGTNAPGMALRLDQSVNVIGAEHFRRSVQRWSCAATTIHDPTDQSRPRRPRHHRGDDIVVPQTMAMVRAAARMAESELARELLVSGRAPEPERDGARALGAHGVARTQRRPPRPSTTAGAAAGRCGSVRGTARSCSCSPRHRAGSRATSSLSCSTRRTAAPRRSGSRWAGCAACSARTSSRPAPTASLPSCPATGSGSRPTSPPVTSRAPCVPTGARSCHAPPLRVSSACATSVEGDLRRAVLGSSRADLMSAWTRSASGADDYEMWQAQARVLGPGSPLIPLVQNQLAPPGPRARHPLTANLGHSTSWRPANLGPSTFQATVERPLCGLVSVETPHRGVCRDAATRHTPCNVVATLR